MRHRRAHTTLLAALVSALTTGLLGGCSATDAHEEPAAPSAKNSRPAPSDFALRHVELPVSDYRLSATEYAEVSRAKNILVTECMERLGFSWSAPTPTVPRQDRRYGVIDLPAAQRYGYHLLPEDNTAPERADHEPSKDETDALTGGQLLDGDTGRSRLLPGYTAPVRKVGGKSVPPGGCSQEAERKLLGRTDLTSEAGVVSRINTDSFTESQQKPAVKKTLAEWSACMRKAGFDYPDPLRSIATARLDSPTVPAAEIELATADVRCKESVDLVDVWSRAEATVQQRMIKQHAAATAKERADKATRLRNAAEVIRASGE
ncbi:hypothetical protein AB0I00_36380 [Streptomyces sp. NPDC050803]|uniref:hypothetical protein n=1 Tax=unclassified Streptomyces TaxID=2593676 RepID=UPI003414933E